MSPEKLKAAVAEAKRFIEKASKTKVKTWEDIYGKKHNEVAQGKDAAAVKRASLDLSRALAALRNTWRYPEEK